MKSSSVLLLLGSSFAGLACNAATPTTSRIGEALSGERIQTELVSPMPEELAHFGAAVVQLDRELWVGEPGASVGAERFAGRVWPYRWDGGFRVGAPLIAQDPVAGQLFGKRLAAADGQVLIGAPGNAIDEGGSVVVFSAETRQQLQVLSSAEAGFGSEFALGGGWLLAAANNSATLFRRQGELWVSEQRLRPADPSKHRDVGQVVGVSESVAAVTSTSADTSEDELLVFERQAGGAWLETKSLQSISCSSLAVDEKRIFCGDPDALGQIYMLSRAKAWEQVALLQTTTETGDFGKVMTLAGDTLSGLGTSAVSVFSLQGERAEEVEPLWAPPTLLSDPTGLDSLSVSEQAIVVGAPELDAGNVDHAGTVLVFAQCSDDASCGSARFCGKAERCEELLALSASCERSTQCGSGYCADGVCCDSACADSCEACAEPNHAGQCVIVSGDPRGERERCTGDDTCRGTCTGLARSCSYPAGQTPCGSSCANGSEIRKLCDGAGRCRNEPEHSCGNYACGDDACLAVCTANEDCRAGAECVSGSCVELSVAHCTRRGDASVGPLGSRSCGAYRCDQASGACLSACSSSSQCGSGYVCDAASRNCVSELPKQADSGCGCRAAGGQREHRTALMAVAILATLLVLRRRRSNVLALGALLMSSGGCQGDRDGSVKEQPASTSAALRQDASWVPGSRLSGGLGFGQALAASGPDLLVGGELALDWLTRNDLDWQLVQHLEPAELPGEGCADLQVKLEADLALVSSMHGARVFFRSKAGQFEEQTRLAGAGANVSAFNGCFIELHGTRVAVADYEQTFLFERSGARFTPVASLPGRVLALTDDAIVVAFEHQDTDLTDVNLYGPWGNHPQLVASLPQPFAVNRMDARAVADSRSLIVAQSGQLAYAYDLSDFDAKPAALRPADAAEHTRFGSAMALSSDVLILGDDSDDTARVFRGSGKNWSPVLALHGQHDSEGRYGSFGASVAIQDEELVVGDPRYWLTPMRFGAAFVYGHCSDAAPCPSGYFCSADAFCAPVKPNGEACDARAGHDCLSDGCAMCESGNCVDGVCCESLCGGQCEACGEPNSPGKCVPVAGAPRAPREACLGSDATCRGSCSGVAPACVYPTSNDACRSRCEDGRETPSSCNGRGDCLERSSRSCLGFACGRDACLDACLADADCASGFACEERVCVAIARAHTCSKDGTRSQTEEGQIPCGFYRCDSQSGDCREECTETSDCAAGLVCDVPRKECVRESSAPAKDSGCSCRLGRQRPLRSTASLAAFAMLCWLGRRKRRSRRVSVA